MKSTVIISAQYKENYGAHDWDGIGACPQHWKNKGGFQFTLPVDSDHLMYGEANCIEVFEQMLLEESNDYEAFEYIDHQIQWSVPTKLDEAKFEKLIKKSFAKHFA